MKQALGSDTDMFQYVLQCLRSLSTLPRYDAFSKEIQARFVTGMKPIASSIVCIFTTVQMVPRSRFS